MHKAHTIQAASAHELASRHMQHRHRRLAIHLTKSSIFDSCARLTPFKLHEPVSRTRVACTIAIAFGRFSSPKNQLSMLERAQSIQGE
jgi:hypothetical protein